MLLQKKKVPKYIIDNIKISSYSDRGNSDKENSDKETSDEEIFDEKNSYEKKSKNNFYKFFSVYNNGK